MTNHGSCEHFFGLGPGHLSDDADRVAREHDAWLTNYKDPGTGEIRHWFSCRNYGEPFDSMTAREVMEELERLGLLSPVEPSSRQTEAE